MGICAAFEPRLLRADVAEGNGSLEHRGLHVVVLGPKTISIDFAKLLTGETRQDLLLHVGVERQAAR